MRILILFIFLSLFSNASFAQEPARDIQWDEERGILSYDISKDSRLKIRVGSADGPIYRTLVNLGGRKAGKNEEPWDGRDETGLIDFKNFGPLHFCVDVLPRPRKDIVLSVDLVKKQPLPLTIDINKEDKKWFLEDKSEIMVFLDKRLIKLKKAKKFPYTFSLDLSPYPPGEHLLTINAWSSDHASVGYKSLFVSSGIKKEKAQPKGAVTKTVLKRIAYCQRHRGFWQVWVANPDGSRSKRLTKSQVDKRYPSFSPDGERIAYVTNEGELWIMGKNGRHNHKTPLPIHASQPRWSSDGKRIIFVSYQDLYHGDTEIWEVDLKNARLKKLTSRPWMQYDPCYSPDATNLIFTDGPELYAQEIRKLDLKTGDVTQLTENGPYDYDMQPAYLSSGERIVYASNQGGNYDIWIMDKFGREAKSLTKHPAHDIMPQVNGEEEIFFLSDRSGAFEVWRMDTDGADLRQVTKNKKDKQDLTLYVAISTENN